MITRRSALKGLLAGSALTASGFALQEFFSDEAAAKSFSNKLKLPPLQSPRIENGVHIFDLAVQGGTSRFLPGLSTPTLGVNGDYLGPTLHLTKGQMTRFNVTNKLSEATTLHWHGLHLPARADGGPHQIIEPGATWSPAFKIDNHAATYWYHSHMLHKTGEQVWKGLAGLMIIEDEDSKRLELPKQYGVDDVPLVLQDRQFNSDGSLQYVKAMPDIMMGKRGNTMLINGTVNPYFTATTRKIRLRILNGSNARFYYLGFDDDRPFEQISSDGGFLPTPYKTTRLSLGPGERCEIVVDVKTDGPLVLQSYPHPLGQGMMGMMRRRMGMMRRMMMGGQSVRDDSEKIALLEIRPTTKLQSSSPVPSQLAQFPVLQARDATRTRRFVMQMRMGPGMMMGGGSASFAINGKAMDKNRIDETIKRGDTEIWEIVNMSPMPHTFHIHDIQFHVLDRNGRPPAPQEMGPKDTVTVDHMEKVRVIAKFDDYTDPERPYMYHCHILEHEDAGMMGQFIVQA